MFVCCFQVSLAWKTISCQMEKGNRVKHRQIWQGNCVEEVNLADQNGIKEFAIYYRHQVSAYLTYQPLVSL